MITAGVKFFWEVFVTLFVIIDPPGTGRCDHKRIIACSI